MKAAILLIMFGWSGMEGEPIKETRIFWAESKSDAYRACEAYGKLKVKLLSEDTKINGRTREFWAGYTCL